ncbi:MAG TPA: hypothetical protein VKE88_01725 [Candidatus Nanoarchaeia archaeon]|nr:hypothetical protein [Candidatus Nanoarchaeia archaeon]
MRKIIPTSIAVLLLLYGGSVLLDLSQPVQNPGLGTLFNSIGTAFVAIVIAAGILAYVKYN